MKLFNFLIAGLIAFSTFAMADPLSVQTLVIENPFIIFYKGEIPGAGYMTIRQTTAENDQLLAVYLDKKQSDQGRVELHDHVSEKINGHDVKKMVTLKVVDIPAVADKENRGTVSFAPGGKHLMLYNFPESLKDLKKVTLILVFKNAGEKTVEFEVRDPSTLSKKESYQNKCGCCDHKD